MKIDNRHPLRLIAKGMLWLLGIVVVYILVMFVLSRITVNSDDTKQTADVVIFIKTNGVHTDIVVPYRDSLMDWSALVAPESVSSQDGIRYVGFGWGDMDFYLNTPQWSDLKASVAFRAVCYLGSSVMHTTFYDRLQENNNCISIKLTQLQYKQLTNYILQGFDNPKDPLQLPGSAYGKHDSFYEGEGRYSICYTCNSWANNALKAADAKAALWTLTDTGIFYHYR